MATPGREVSWVQIFKYIVIGDAGVGKSCLLLQFTDQRFRPELDPTIGFEASSRIVDIDGKRTKLQIWDTAGQEFHRSMTKPYYRGAAAAILVYDITRRETFDHVESWLKDAVEVVPTNLTTILVGNKCDLNDRRTVSYEEGESFAKTHGLFFIESSAKTAHNVEEAFTIAARTVSKKIEDGVLDPSAKGKGEMIWELHKCRPFVLGSNRKHDCALLMSFNHQYIGLSHNFPTQFTGLRLFDPKPTFSRGGGCCS